MKKINYEGKDYFLVPIEELETINPFTDKKIEQPYIKKARVVIDVSYNPNYGDDRICQCGHPYYRHFDSYEKMEPVGCKYCGCYDFVPAEKIKAQIKGSEVIIGYKLKNKEFVLARGVDVNIFSKKIKEFICKNFEMNDSSFFELNRNLWVEFRNKILEELGIKDSPEEIDARMKDIRGCFENLKENFFKI